MKYIFLAALGLYKWILSPILVALFGASSGCRFQPTCSEYAADAFKTHGTWRATQLTAGRLLRCQPFPAKNAKHNHGFDPVPPPTPKK